MLEYALYLGGEWIGKVCLRRQGLYYRISCTCMLTGEVMYKLVVDCNGSSLDLGILVPCANHFGLDTKVPIKKIGEGELTFQIKPKHPQLAVRFIPVYPEEPFSYINRLKDAYFEKRNGQAGICIPE